MSESTLRCPHCSAPLSRANARFCRNCGHPLAPVVEQRQRSYAPRPSGGVDVRLIGIVGVIAVAAFAVLLWTRPWQAGEPEPASPPIAGAPQPEAPAAADTPTPQLPKVTAPPTATLILDPTAPPIPTDTPVTPPTATPPPSPTDTPISTATATPVPQAIVRDNVNLRVGPDTVFEVVRLLGAGEKLTVLGQNQGQDWLRVRTTRSEEGWAAARFIDASALTANTIAVIATPPLPSCSLSVDSRFQGVYDRSQLGCPTAGLSTVWSAWESFQRGAMLWRNDTNQVVVFYNSGRWTQLTDQWTGQDTPYRGSPPPGLYQPIRGFGWIWGNRDEVFSGLGWATDEEKGVCMLIQQFQRGFIITKSGDGFCRDRSGNSNFSRAAELPSLFIVAHSDGDGWRTY